MRLFSTIVIAAFSLLACTINALAVPGDQELYMLSVQMSAGNLALGVLEVTDDRFPGVVFTGTAQSVYEEMKALKPEAFPDTDGTDVVRERAVGVLNCEWGIDVFGAKSCDDGIDHLKRLNRANCCVRGGFEHCARVSCSYGCGIYLCNKTNNGYCAACGDVGNDANDIRNKCDSDSSNTPSGAEDFDGHFIGVSMATCKKPNTGPPS